MLLFLITFRLALCKVDQEKAVLCKKLFLQTYFSVCAHTMLDIMKVITIYFITQSTIIFQRK